MTKRSYIETCYTCNSNCISCPCPTSWQKQGVLSFARLKAYFDRHTGPGSVVNINGGEPTLHPDFIGIVKYAAKSGARVGLLSNGRAFCDRKFAESAVKAGLKDICIPLHSSNPGVHDRFTRSKGSCAETIKGLKNLLQLKTAGYPIKIIIKLLICKSTIKFLPETVRFICKEFTSIDTILIEAMDIVCSALENRKKTLITLTAAQPYIAQAVHIGLAHRQNIQLHYIPPCIFPEPESYFKLIYRDSKENQNILGPERYLENLGLDNAAVKTLACKKCDANNFCPGVWRSYKEVVGLDELGPIIKLRQPRWLER